MRTARLGASTARLFGLFLLALAIAQFSFGEPALAQVVNGLDIWYVDEPGRTIYRVDPVTGNVIASFPVPIAVVTPAGLGVTGTPGGGTSLMLLDSAADQIYRLNPNDGTVVNVIPAPSPNAIGIGDACIVPLNVEELFVVANDADPGALYWTQPANGAILNRCALFETDIRDATAFALGNNGTGVCFLQNLIPGGTQITCVNKLNCIVIWDQIYPWEGWGLGNRTVGNVQGTATQLYASDLGNNVLHVLNGANGAEVGQIPTAISGASIRGVGGDSSCPVIGAHGIPTLQETGIVVLIILFLSLGAYFVCRNRRITSVEV